MLRVYIRDPTENCIGDVPLKEKTQFGALFSPRIHLRSMLIAIVLERKVNFIKKK